MRFKSYSCLLVHLIVFVSSCTLPKIDQSQIQIKDGFVIFQNKTYDGFVFTKEDSKISKIESYKQGKLNGNTKSYDVNGNCLVEIDFLNNVQDGSFIERYKNGQTKEVAHYENGLLTKLRTIYHFNGEVKSEVSYDKSVFHGQHRTCYLDGLTKKLSSYEHGILHGREIQYYRSGMKKIQTEYVKGLIDGVQKSWFENGNMKTEQENYLGVRCGEETSYFESGGLRYNGFFEDSIKYGLHTKYDMAGNIVSEIEYDADMIDGLAKTYSRNSIAKAIEYKQGIKHGTQLTFYQSGAKKSVEHFKNGEKHGLQTFWYKNGNKSKELYIENKKIVGGLKQWNANGALINNR